MNLRLAFMGSPDFAAPTLRALIAAGHDIACVYTQPPRPAGRGQRARNTAIHDLADSHGLEVRTPTSLKSAEAQSAFAALNLDAAIVLAYGLILPQPILDAPRLGCLNLHASLLPRWRGAAPIQRALMAGDAKTGVCVMQMDAGLDTGPVYACAETPIEADDTAASLHDRLAALGAPLICDTLARLARGEAHATPQPSEGVTYAHKITAAETRIDWSRPAREIDSMIRGLSPHPGAWFHWPSPRGPVRIKALKARLGRNELAAAPGIALDDALLIACGEGAVRLLSVQRQGKEPMSAVDFLRGASIQAGARLD
jgi:methionyl-tRNA formyltransferase